MIIAPFHAVLRVIGARIYRIAAVGGARIAVVAQLISHIVVVADAGFTFADRASIFIFRTLGVKVAVGRLHDRRRRRKRALR